MNSQDVRIIFLYFWYVVTPYYEIRLLIYSETIAYMDTNQ